ncbi:uncharacterized protein EV422DRAFT_542324 [Fimicolochytrium jonesii]|uniref:uncharacterized protein n=1 Tax=Fimicolochytrium jonesii TaxID=1396493 RepID=UPI0022FE6FA8|nr:uncharacterized protein EV422DRAFT_542324 [Fimicolochytrium jonesii]KAI8817298.1 hypothetical protein EV422DRAFT_542324 [Fimicolochytrium jonesii]
MSNSKTHRWSKKYRQAMVRDANAMWDAKDGEATGTETLGTEQEPDSADLFGPLKSSESGGKGGGILDLDDLPPAEPYDSATTPPASGGTASLFQPGAASMSNKDRTARRSSMSTGTFGAGRHFIASELDAALADMDEAEGDGGGADAQARRSSNDMDSTATPGTNVSSTGVSRRHSHESQTSCEGTASLSSNESNASNLHTSWATPGLKPSLKARRGTMANVPAMAHKAPFIGKPPSLGDAGSGPTAAGPWALPKAPFPNPDASTTRNSAKGPSSSPKPSRKVRFSEIVTTIAAETDQESGDSDESRDSGSADPNQQAQSRSLLQAKPSNPSLASSADTLNSTGKPAGKMRAPKGAKAAAAITAAAALAVVAEPVVGGKGLLIRPRNSDRDSDVESYQSDESDREQAVKGRRKSQAVRRLTKVFRKAFPVRTGAVAAAGAPTPTPVVPGEENKLNVAAVHAT